MDEKLKFKPFGISALILVFIGWGGLYYLITQTLPYVWPRWGFFILSLMALTGTLLPIVYFFHKRFPDEETPAEANVIVRQAMWFGVYGATLAWLQLGRLVTVYVILGMAGGLAAIEYFLRLRERSHWKPPAQDE
jgi:drug/metabolite transporter (DMT)-like permease